jgi:predicted DNA-binding protein
MFMRSERTLWASRQPSTWPFGVLHNAECAWPWGVGEAKIGGSREHIRPALAVSRYHGVMTRQTTVRLPDELAEQAEAVARVQGSSVNTLIVESLAAEIERVRADRDFTQRAKKLLARDKELLDRLAR